jgi:hypothetical protein
VLPLAGLRAIANVAAHTWNRFRAERASAASGHEKAHLAMGFFSLFFRSDAALARY